jgi:hypothetical protein
MWKCITVWVRPAQGWEVKEAIAGLIKPSRTLWHPICYNLGQAYYVLKDYDMPGKLSNH